MIIKKKKKQYHSKSLHGQGTTIETTNEMFPLLNILKNNLNIYPKLEMKRIRADLYNQYGTLYIPKTIYKLGIVASFY